MRGINLNHLKFSLTSVKTRLVVRNIIIFSFEVMRSQKIGFNSKIHLSPVSVRSKRNSQRDTKITKNVS